MNTQIIHPTFNAAPQVYEAAVQTMRALISEGLREPAEGMMDAAYFTALRDQIPHTPRVQVKKHASV